MIWDPDKAQLSTAYNSGAKECYNDVLIPLLVNALHTNMSS